MSAERLRKSSLAVCLRGFPEREQAQAAKLLSSRGHRVVRSLGAAQFVVAGPEAEPSLLQATVSHGLEITSWEAVRQELEWAEEIPTGDAPTARETIHPMFRNEDGREWFLDIALPARAESSPCDQKHIPPASRFAGLCFDQPFAETLQAVLTGILQAMPVALEGETAASKTSAILYLAHRLGQPVLRLNLNGQTDAGELVGRFIPASGGWAFQENALPVAMRRGHWLLLDEMNLAEPQVLERLNPALETPPTLILSEGHGTVIGPGGDVETHPAFRLLATLNPAEYSGRSILSPAFRNRWLIWHQAGTPNEAELLAMLRTLVFGEQPVVHWRGRAWQAPAGPAALPELGILPGIGPLLEQLAHFHAAVAKAASPAAGCSPGLARHRRERDTFTRRNLLAALRLFQAGLANEPDHAAGALAHAIEQIYIRRYADPADRKAIHAHARAAGLI